MVIPKIPSPVLLFLSQKKKTGSSLFETYLLANNIAVCIDVNIITSSELEKTNLFLSDITFAKKTDGS